MLGLFLFITTYHDHDPAPAPAWWLTRSRSPSTFTFVHRGAKKAKSRGQWVLVLSAQHHHIFFLMQMRVQHHSSSTFFPIQNREQEEWKLSKKNVLLHLSANVVGGVWGASWLSSSLYLLVLVCAGTDMTRIVIINHILSVNSKSSTSSTSTTATTATTTTYYYAAFDGNHHG